MKKIMNKEEMNCFIQKVGRTELDIELKKHKNRENNYAHLYLKAIRVTLLTLGYDEKWVENEFRDALEMHFYSE